MRWQCLYATSGTFLTICFHSRIDFNLKLQEALAIVLENELKRLDSTDSNFNTLRLELQGKRDFMINLLTEVGFKPVIPQGGYFILADWSNLGKVFLLFCKNFYIH